MSEKEMPQKTYDVWYRYAGGSYDRLRNVLADLVINNNTKRRFICADGSWLEVPESVEFKFSPERAQIIHANILEQQEMKAKEEAARKLEVVPAV